MKKRAKSQKLLRKLRPFRKDLYRKSTLIAIAVVALCAGAVGYGLNRSGTHAAASQIFCNTFNPLSADCVNASRGGQMIIGWKMDWDNNENFEIDPINRCGGDVVTYNCPFATAAYNSRYLGDQIFQLKYLNNTDLCLAATSSGTYDTYLAGCNSSSGFGGAFGTIFVYNTVRATSGFVESRYLSDYNTQRGISHPAWLCDYSKAGNSATSITADGATGTGQACQWEQ
jgi:hypothetical protein